jgi:hypothetical protein
MAGIIMPRKMEKNTGDSSIRSTGTDSGFTQFIVRGTLLVNVVTSGGRWDYPVFERPGGSIAGVMKPEASGQSC